MKSNHQNLGFLSGFFAGLSAPVLFTDTIFSTQTTASRSGQELDLEALQSDWLEVGQSFHLAVNQYQTSHSNEIQKAKNAAKQRSKT